MESIRLFPTEGHTVGRDLFSGPHLIIVLVIVLLLFGATRLPALARSIGKSSRILKEEMRGTADSTDSPPIVVPEDQAAPQAQPAASTTDRGADKP